MPNEIEIYSEEVQSIIEHRPNWLIRNSILSIFLILVIVITVSMIVKYPESTVVQGFKLESKTPSYQFISQTQGNLKLLAKNGSKVKKGEWIAFVENTASVESIKEICEYVEFVEPLIYSDSIIQVPIKNEIKAGDLEIYYSGFLKNLETLKTYVELDPDSYKILSDKNEIIGQKTIINSKQQEIKKANENLELKKSKLDANLKLFEKGYLSKIDYENIKQEYNDAEKNYINLLTNVKTQETNIVQLKDRTSQTIVNKKVYLSDLKRNCINSFLVFKEELNKWKEKHIFIAPYNGEVDLLRVWNSNHFVNIGEHLITLKPIDTQVMGRGYITGKNLGKVKKDQKVIIKLDGYLSTEYGLLVGKVNSVSTYPNEENLYMVDVGLSELKTSYGVDIPFRPELAGHGEIILKDQTLFELFIKNIKKLVQNGNS